MGPCHLVLGLLLFFRQRETRGELGGGQTKDCEFNVAVIFQHSAQLQNQRQPTVLRDKGGEKTRGYDIN